MRKIARLDALKRDIRQDDIPELAVSTWDIVTELFSAGKIDEAKKYLDYACSENRRMHDTGIVFVSTLLDSIATSLGEEQVEKLLRDRYTPRAKEWLEALPDAKGTLIRLAESLRGHYSTFTASEEPNRYVLRFDPCGSGGRLMRTAEFGVTKKPHPWSWERAGVSYYCTHCCMFLQLLPIELRGYPLVVIQPPAKPEDPCVHFIYKNPDLIPEKYYREVGKAKAKSS